MAILQINLFGSFQVSLAGIPVTHFATSKVRALLTYLAVERDSPHSRESLAGLLWPEYPEVDALHNLRLTLSRLRQSLEDILRSVNISPETARLFSITRTHLQLHPDASILVDIHEFQNLLSRCETHAHPQGGNCLICMQQRIQAVELYRGDFLEGFSVKDALPFEEWAVLKRERLHHQVLETLEILTDQFLVEAQSGPGSKQANQLEKALLYARQQLQLEPWHEAAHRQLMISLALNGQLQDALTQYEICSQVLNEEFGLQPDEETARLYNDIKSSRSSLSSGVHISNQTRVHCHLPPQPFPIIGREAQLNRLKNILYAPDYRWITLVGESGIGKTRLAIAAVEQVMHSFPDGICYIPLRELAPPRNDLQDKLTIEHILATAIGSTINCGFDFSYLRRQEPRQQVLDFFCDKRLLLLLDDFDYFSEGAGFLLDIIRAAPQVCLVVTSRQLRNFQTGYVMRLEGLEVPKDLNDPDASEYSGLRLFSAYSGQAIHRANQNKIIQICRLVDGWPMGIALCAALSKTQSLESIATDIQRQLNRTHVAPSNYPVDQPGTLAVVDIVWNRLQPAEQQILLDISQLNGSFDPEALSAITGISQSDLDSLIEKFLLVRNSYDRFELPFLIRQVISQKFIELEINRAIGIQYSKENKIHSRSVQQSFLEENNISAFVKPSSGTEYNEPALQYPNSMIRQRYTQYYLDRLIKTAHTIQPFSIHAWADTAHFLQAWFWGLEYGVSEQLDSWLEALVDILFQSGLYLHARHTIDLSLQLIRQQLPSGKESNGAHPLLLKKLQLASARTEFVLGNPEHTLRLANAAVGNGQALNLPDIEAEARFYLGKVYAELGLDSQAEEELTKALRLTNVTIPPNLQAEIHLALGQVISNRSDLQSATDQINQAFRLFDQTGAISGKARSLISLANLSEKEEKLEETRELLLQALALEQDQDILLDQNVVYHRLAHIYAATGSLDLACIMQEKALSISSHLGDRPNQVLSLVELAKLHNYCGDPWQARNEAERALRIARIINNLKLECVALLQLASACRFSGDIEIAQAHNRYAIIIARQTQDVSLIASAQVALASSLEFPSEWQEAKDTYEQVLSSTQNSQLLSTISLLAHAGMARFYLHQNDFPSAIAQIEHILYQVKNPYQIPFPEVVDILWTCWKVLVSMNDLRAKAILSDSYQVILHQVSNTSDINIKRSFLEKVNVHREIIQTWNSEFK